MPYYRTLRTRIAPGFALLLMLATAHRADAQMGGMGGGGGGMGGMGGMGGGQTPAADMKKDGVATAAPSTPGLLPTTPALPAPKSRRKRWKLFEMDGYYRLRTDWFKNFNLGFIDNPSLGGAPFPRAANCTPATVGAEGELNRPCDDSLASANMRLRLEPTFNIDEGTSVHVQADVFDNLVLGSTPINQNYSGIYTTTNKPPTGAFTDTQSPPVQGVNSDRESITVKRAWGEVALPLGILKFGRQPNQWGMGIYANAGGFDPNTGVTNYDADYGDSVDRVSFSALIPGTNLRAMIALDWPMTQLVSNQTSANVAYAGHPFDLDDSSDANQYVGVISKIDSPQDFRDIVDRGDLALNYGIYFTYRTQSWAEDLTGFTLGQTFDAADNYVPRGLKMYTPDVWIKAGYHDWLFEGEFVAQLGKIDRLDDAGLVGSADIEKFGGAARAIWKGVDGKLRLGFETGFASGDQWDNTIQGQTNIAYQNQLGGVGDTTLSQFTFNRDYQIDMIMWRYLFGAVTNAWYLKPYVQYDITKSIMVKVSNISSLALKPVATPGNGVMYGTEFDGDVGYNDGRLFAGISFGVLFPFGAMAHPVDDVTAGGPGFGYGTDANGNANTGDAGTAYSIQTRLVLKL